jgi:hypothetical protein
MTLRRFFQLAVLSSPLLGAVAHAAPSPDAFLNEARSLVMNTKAIRVATQKQLSHRDATPAKASLDATKAPSGSHR